VIGGVAGGLADYSGIDALLWRVGFVALTLTGGFGILVYVLLWLLMPAGPPGPDDAAAEPRARRDRGPRSPVPGVTLAALLIVVGILVLLNRFTGWDADPRVFPGAALLVVGLGLVAAAFSGGRTARGGLIALGVVLSFALIGASSVPWDHVRSGVGDRTYTPMTAGAVRPVYEGGVGDVRIDLSAIDVSDLHGRPIETRLDAGIGDVTILVPRDADVSVSADSGIGDVRVFGRSDGRGDNGYFPGTGSGNWVDDGEPEIDLTISAGIGSVEVSRA
jgi:phage shock protein PspC (stress-responsive transcriptional regulator)